MVGVEYGNSKVRVIYSRSRNRSSSSCDSSCSGYSTARFTQLQVTSNGNKTANIYVKNCSVYIGYSVRVTSWL